MLGIALGPQYTNHDPTSGMPYVTPSSRVAAEHVELSMFTFVRAVSDGACPNTPQPLKPRPPQSVTKYKCDDASLTPR